VRCAGIRWWQEAEASLRDSYWLCFKWGRFAELQIRCEILKKNGQIGFCAATFKITTSA